MGRRPAGAPRRAGRADHGDGTEDDGDPFEPLPRADKVHTADPFAALRIDAKDQTNRDNRPPADPDGSPARLALFEVNADRADTVKAGYTRL